MIKKEYSGRIRELYEKGITSYKEISKIISEEFNITLSDDTVRYHAVRKHKDESIPVDSENIDIPAAVLGDILKGTTKSTLVKKYKIDIIILESIISYLTESGYAIHQEDALSIYSCFNNSTYIT
ncbi:MAG TPA: hypothetical protein VIO64_11110 [Pseudobacteroides sp.]|uniref:hypothetical protein n=1 Tax=Pseudobacteroides sp. TaxID=1968840 RepID=UPI002F9522D0